MTIPKYILPEKQGNYKFMVFKMVDDSYVRFHKLSIEDIPIGLPLPQHPEIVDAFAKEIGIYVKTMGGGLCLFRPEMKEALFHGESTILGKFDKMSLENAIAGLEKEYEITIH